MFHDLPHWAFKLLGSLLGAAVLFLLLSLSHIPSAAHGDSQLALVHTTDTTLVPTSDWNLTLVNPWTPLPAGHTITVTHLRGGQSIDQRCYPALQAMMDACRAAGHAPVICSSYRSHSKQEALFAGKVQRLMAAGYDAEEADQKAATVVARPGTSEHELGLAVDIVDASYQQLDEGQAFTPVQQWLMEHCWEYGFILRYPDGKSDLTGIIYEPWHYRYVGVETAQALQKSGQCLEEYLQAAKAS